MILCKNIFTPVATPAAVEMVLSVLKETQEWLEILSLEDEPNCIICSKVTEILLTGWTLPIGGIASGRVCAYSVHSRLVYM